ncbi:hypothetical protein GCM10023192_22970 [Amycolatopsis samaneae]
MGGAGSIMASLVGEVVTPSMPPMLFGPMASQPLRGRPVASTWEFGGEAGSAVAVAVLVTVVPSTASRPRTRVCLTADLSFMGVILACPPTHAKRHSSDLWLTTGQTSVSKQEAGTERGSAFWNAVE